MKAALEQGSEESGGQMEEAQIKAPETHGSVFAGAR
jgi:hypothetical protein